MLNAPPHPSRCAPSVWTRVSDDTGGGHSLTSFEILYFEGSEEDAFLAITEIFGVQRNASSLEYGPCFSAMVYPDFEHASWFERGADWDRALGTSVERARNPGQRLHSAQDWMGRCEVNIENALTHANDSKASRHGKMFALDRPGTLAAIYGSFGTSFGPDDALRAEEVMESALGLKPGANERRLNWAGAKAWRYAAFSMHQPQGGEERANWTRLFERLTGADYEVLSARGLSLNNPTHLDSGLVLALTAPELQDAACFERFVQSLSTRALDMLNRITCASLPFSESEAIFQLSDQGSQLIARLEALTLARTTSPVVGRHLSFRL